MAVSLQLMVVFEYLYILSTVVNVYDPAIWAPSAMNRFSLLTVLVQAAAALAGPLVARASEPDPSLAFSVTVDGQTFINKVRATHVPIADHVEG